MHLLMKQQNVDEANNVVSGILALLILKPQGLINHSGSKLFATNFLIFKFKVIDVSNEVVILPI